MNITFKNWLHFNETATVGIKGYDYHQNMGSIEEIATAISYNVIQRHIKLRNPQSKVPFYEIVISDDDSAEPIINFHSGGWAKEIVDRMVQEIKKTLDNNGIKYGTFRYENSNQKDYGPVIRIPILHIPKSQGAPSINMTNDNASVILRDILKLNIQNINDSEIGAADLLIAIQKVERDMVDLHSRDYYGHKTPQGAESHHMGLSPEKIIRHLGELGQLAQWALQKGYDTLQIS